MQRKKNKKTEELAEDMVYELGKKAIRTIERGRGRTRTLGIARLRACLRLWKAIRGDFNLTYVGWTDVIAKATKDRDLELRNDLKTTKIWRRIIVVMSTDKKFGEVMDADFLGPEARWGIMEVRWGIKEIDTLIAKFESDQRTDIAKLERRRLADTCRRVGIRADDYR